MHPHLFHLGPITITTYGAFAAFGLVLAMLLAERNARVKHIDPDAVWNLCLVAIVSTLLLSRAVLIAQNPQSFLRYPMLILTLPTVTQFGLGASLVSGLAYALYRKLPLLSLADVLSPAAMVLVGCLHLGDLLAGNDIGIATTSIFGHIIPSLRAPGPFSLIGSYPVALFSAVAAMLIAVLGLMWLPRSHPPGEIAGATLILASGAAYLCDLLRPEEIAPPFTILHQSPQQLSLVGLILCGGFLLLERREKPRAV